MTAAFAGLVTFVFTTVLTVAGVGAAFILIPVFLALGIDVHTAMATALLLNSVAMTVASVRFVRRGLVIWPVAVPVLIVASALSPLGAWVSLGLDHTVLLWAFVAFLLFAALIMLFYRPRPRAQQVGWGPLVGIGTGVGGAAGFVGGLLGVGGGNIIVPALVAAGFEPKKASATTSFIVIFSSFTGFLGHASLAGVNLPLLGWTVGGSAAGALVGSWLMTDRLQGRQVKTAGPGVPLSGTPAPRARGIRIRRRIAHGLLLGLIALLTVSGCRDSSGPQAVAAALETQLAPPAGSVVRLDLRRSAWSAEVRWHVRTEWDWDRYADWLSQRLTQFDARRRTSDELWLVRETPGDVQAIFVGRTTAADARYEVRLRLSAW